MVEEAASDRSLAATPEYRESVRRLAQNESCDWREKQVKARRSTRSWLTADKELEV